MRALVLIDFQKGFDNPVWGERNNPDAEAVALRLLDHWRVEGAPIYHVQHMAKSADSLLAGDAGAFMEGFGRKHEDEAVIQKSENSAFIHTRMEHLLRRAKITDLVVGGLTTPHCVSTTVRMAANLGFRVELVEDACAAFTTNADMSWKDGETLPAQVVHDMALAHLHCEFCTVVQSADVQP